MGTDPGTDAQGQAGAPSDSTDDWAPRDYDDGIPNSARMYDYWLGGKDNYAVDREMAELFLQQIPSLRDMARANRDFVHRATAMLTSKGIRQFIDIGTGIPTSPNLHETAQGIVPEAHVVYVDNDPVVLSHARALMPSSDQGTVAYVDADLRDPEKIFAVPEVTRVIDLGQPVAVMLIAVLMLLDEHDDPYAKVAALRQAVPSGSYLALTHPTQDFDPEAMGVVTTAATQGGMTFEPRSEAQIARFFGDWDLVSPGLVPVLSWRPDQDPDDPKAAYYWAGVARKP